MRKFWLVLRQAVDEFLNDNGMKLSASLSYYTIFSLGPVLMIVIALAGIFFGREAVEGKIYYQINGLVGNQAAAQIQEIIQNIEQSHESSSGAIFGVIVLIIGATGVFTEIQDSINYIWSIKAKPKRGYIKLLFNRFISFSLIIGFGFILMVSLVLHALIDLLYEKLARFFADTILFLFQGINYLLLFGIISVLFTIIFKVLPDARIRWRDAYVGACFTSVLFMIGKFAIGFYLGNSDVSATFGAAASLIILLLWVYYTSIILFFGAEFTKVYTLNFGGGIVPEDTAVFIIKQESKELHITKEVLDKSDPIKNDPESKK
ncbi:MAG TPA: YihY/virulence factor BrkB family protein [Chryseosolibacter sp.]